MSPGKSLRYLRFLPLVIGTVAIAVFSPAAEDVYEKPVIVAPEPAFVPVIDETYPDTIPNEIIADWKDQDGIVNDYASSIAEITDAFPEIADKITSSGETGYLQACHWRRVSRMRTYGTEIKRIMFCRHHNFGGTRIGYHDNADPGNSDEEWVSRGALSELSMQNYYAAPVDLLTKTDAVVRDPCISLDGKKVLFAMSGYGKGTGYKIHEMVIGDSSTVRQLTDDPDEMVVADFEPCYLPNGDIMFSSTRNFTSDAYGINTVTNMFLMDGQGNYIRQIGFDQAHTFHPVLMDDGAVLYSRREYNDRSVTDCMGLFSMQSDGTRQLEYFGNQTKWPMTIIHARQIPDSPKIIAIAGGYHGPYAGELMIIDPSRGLNGFNGIECIKMVAPLREPEPDQNDFSSMVGGGVNYTFQTPFPLNDEHFLVSWRKSEEETKYRLYFMDVAGNRELLAWGDQSVSQPVLIRPRTVPSGSIKSQVDYTDSTGTFAMMDVYYGKGMEGITKGEQTAKTLRVVKLGYRTTGTGITGGALLGSGPPDAYSPAVILPVSAYGASVEIKDVLGETNIYPDGSAAFKVPARTPVYFQVLDSMGCCIATMRSWSTLMPGEILSCIGCHEDRNNVPPSDPVPMAGFGLDAPELSTPLGIENKPFDYEEMVQPIFDQHCVNCHTAGHESGFDLSGDHVNAWGGGTSWTRSYVSLMDGIGPVSSNTAVNICTIFSGAEQQQPYSFGSSLSGIMLSGGLSGDHHAVQISEKERKIVACWIDLCAPHYGRYDRNLSESAANTYMKMEEKRTRWAAMEKENINAMLENMTGTLPSYYAGNNVSVSHGDKKPIRFKAEKRALILPGTISGTLLLMDLKGRVVFKKKFSVKHEDGTITVSLPEYLSNGLYLARFQGIDGKRQKDICIVR